MSEKYFIDPETKTLVGIFVDGATPPDGAVEVPEPPPHGRAVWNGQGWTFDALALERAGMVCSRFQVRAALHQAGLLPKVEAAVAAADPLVQIAWADATSFRRDSVTLAAVAATLGLKESEIDDLFRSAMQIVA